MGSVLQSAHENKECSREVLWQRIKKNKPQKPIPFHLPQISWLPSGWGIRPVTRKSWVRFLRLQSTSDPWARYRPPILLCGRYTLLCGRYSQCRGVFTFTLNRESHIPCPALHPQPRVPYRLLFTDYSSAFNIIDTHRLFTKGSLRDLGMKGRLCALQAGHRCSTRLCTQPSVLHPWLGGHTQLQFHHEICWWYSKAGPHLHKQWGNIHRGDGKLVSWELSPTSGLQKETAVILHTPWALTSQRIWHELSKKARQYLDHLRQLNKFLKTLYSDAV